jgi:tRNA (guanine37-N1)-methyltransferase
VGDSVLTGGELPAKMVVDAVSRMLPGVLGNQDSLAVESFEKELLEAPSFTKPDEFEGKRTVSEFLKGNHSKIAAIKNRMALCKTKYFRPDLYLRAKAKV